MGEVEVHGLSSGDADEEAVATDGFRDLLGVLVQDLATTANRGVAGGPEDLRAEWFTGKQVVGVTAGASAPELLVQRVVARLKEWGGQDASEVEGRAEHVVFALPRELRLVASGRDKATD